jgi:SpoVK/Ycf46/Vps4 family AAA+-type ATPase
VLAVLLLFLLFIVLHPWIRLDLGLTLYWDQVRVELTTINDDTTYNRSLVPLNDVRLERVQVVENVPHLPVPAWYRPSDYSFSLPVHQEAIQKQNHGQAPVSEPSECLFSVGSLVQRSWMTVEEEDSSMSHHPPMDFVRLLLKQAAIPSRRGIQSSTIIALSRKDLSQLWNELIQKEEDSSKDDPDPASSSSLVYTEMDSHLAPEFVLPQQVDWMQNELLPQNGIHHQVTVLCGPPGSGKTHSAILLAAMTRIKQHRATLYLDCKRLQESPSMRMSDILGQFQSLFEKAVRGRPCLILLDELDRLAPNLMEGENENDTAARVQHANPTALDQSKLIADRLIQLLEAVAVDSVEDTPGGNVSVVITCATAESLHPALLRAAKYHRIVQIPNLTSEERFALLGKMVKDHVSEEAWNCLDQSLISQWSEGFRPRDLEKVASRVRQVLRNDHESNILEAISSVLHGFVPLSHLSLRRQPKAVGPRWSDLGGLFRVKSKLASTILHPVKYRRIYEKANIRLPRGILLFGPPGTGKSALVPALAEECNFPLVTCRGPEILDKYIGASEAKVRELFARACAVAPSILFLDELDALAPRRGSDHTGVTDRVVNQLLTFLDGVEDTAASAVYIIAATSRPDKVDPALLRPGRLEQHLFVGPPESHEEWTDLFSKIAQKWNMTDNDRQTISSNALFVNDAWASNPHARSFSAADLKAVMDTAHVCAVHKALRTSAADEIEEVTIELTQIKEALSKTRACLSTEDARALQEVYRPFLCDNDFRETSADGDAASGTPIRSTTKTLRTALM